MDFRIFMEFEIRAANQAGASEEGFHLVDAAEAWGLGISALKRRGKAGGAAGGAARGPPPC